PLCIVRAREPFASRHADRRLALLAERNFDVLFSTNGTLLGRHVEALARLRNLGLMLSVDGEAAPHARVRAPGTFRGIREAVDALFEARRRAGAPSPLLLMTFVVC